MRRIILLAALTAAMTGSIATAASASEFMAPTSLDFPSQTVGTTSAAKTTTLVHNCDGGAVGVCTSGIVFSPVISVTGNFAQTNNCPPVLITTTFPSGPATCTISVTFSPTAAGSRSGTLSTGGPPVPLTGTGIAAPVTPTTPVTTPRKKCKKGKKGATSAKKKKCKKK